MRDISPQLQAHLDSGATTLCHCWKLTRRDGVIFGFTDHDRPLSFDGVDFEPQSGATASAIETAAGLAADNMSVIGALNSDALNEDDLAAGLFDGADVEIYRVNWADANQRLLLKAGTLGEIARGPVGFAAELRGLAAALEQTAGRRYQHGCDADLGDPRCGVDLNDPAFRGVGAVTAVEADRILTVSGLAAFADDWFSRGRLEWTSGANSGRAMEVKAHEKGAGDDVLELWRAMSAGVVIGDAFIVTAGCDKRFETCRDRFSNVVNFRGFHLMPGNDFLQITPQPGEGRVGGPLR